MTGRRAAPLVAHARAAVDLILHGDWWLLVAKAVRPNRGRWAYGGLRVGRGRSGDVQRYGLLGCFIYAVRSGVR